MKLEDAVEKTAVYLRGLAQGHRPLPHNVPRAVGTALGINQTVVLEAVAVLVRTSRLRGYESRAQSIDGFKFRAVTLNTEIERKKKILRKYFPQVIDPRTLEDPSRVPKGPPVELVLGGRRVTWEEAELIAEGLSP